MPLSLDFAFEGFRIIREKPKLILFWGLVLLIGGVLSQVLMVGIAGPDMERFQAVVNAHDANGLMNLTRTASPNLTAAFLAILPIELLTNAILSCAVFRAVWGEKDDRFGYLRFGGDEWRQVAVLFLMMLLSTVLFAAVITVVITIAGVAGDTAPSAAGALLALIAGTTLGVIVLLRLSLCTVQSFDRKTIDIFGSWKLTAKHAWALLGGYLVAAVMAALVYILCSGILVALVALAGAGRFSSIGSPDLTSLQAYFTPMTIVGLVFVHMLIMPLIAALRFGALAAAYRTLAGHARDPGI